MDHDAEMSPGTALAEYVRWLRAVRGLPTAGGMTDELRQVATPAAIAEYDRLAAAANASSNQHTSPARRQSDG